MKFSMLTLSSLIFSFTISAFAQTTVETYRSRRPVSVEGRVEEQAAPSDDLLLVEAVASRRNQRYLQAAKLKVVALLKDDNSGLRHQKFTVVTSSGQKVLCVYNLDQGQRIPLKVGDEVGLGGEFKWTNVGALMHWLHEDDSNKRPDGYVELAGRRYGLN